MKVYKTILFYLTLVLLLVLLKFYIDNRDLNYRNSIVNGKFDKTVGYFDFVSTGGDANFRSLGFFYFVNKEKYERQVKIDRHAFSDCFRDELRCKNYKFWVIYSKGNPDKSLIDLSRIFTNADTVKFPTTLSNFE
jgi:hypothetical protein